MDRIPLARQRQPSVAPAASAAEIRIRAAVDELAEALIALMRQQPPPASETVELLSVPAAAQLLGVVRSTVYAAIAAGEIRSVLIRSRRLVPRSEVDRLAAGRAR